MPVAPPPFPSLRKPSEVGGLVWGVAALVGVFFWAIPALMENTIGTKFRSISHELGFEIPRPASLLLAASSLYSDPLGILAILALGGVLTGGYLLIIGRRLRIGYIVGVGLLLVLWAALFFFGLPALAFLVPELSSN